MAWPVTKAPVCRCVWGTGEGHERPRRPLGLSSVSPGRGKEAVAGRAPRLAASLRTAEPCRSATARVAQTRQLLCVARPRSLARVGAERGPASARGDAAQQHRPHRHQERVALRDPLREALSRARLSSTRRSGASESLGLQAPSRALEGTGWGWDAGGQEPGAAGSRLCSTPRRPRRAPSQLSSPTRCGRSSPAAATVPDPEPCSGVRSFRAGGGCYDWASIGAPGEGVCLDLPCARRREPG